MFRGGQYTEYVFAGPDMPAILEVVHLAHRTYGATAALVARIPPMPLVLLHPGCRRGCGPAASRQRHPL